MKNRSTLIIASLTLLIACALFAMGLKWRGFRANSTPTVFETAAARSIRDFAIPVSQRHKTNPNGSDRLAVEQGRDDFLVRCASCHGVDARGRTPIGANVYPRCLIFTSNAGERFCAERDVPERGYV